jgi:exonuclease SbcD
MPTLRILHTSDWHLGALFHEQARDADEQRALDALVVLARDEAVDAVLIAGDVFDGVNPPAAAQERWYRTLHRLRHEAGVGCVLAIGGNHDHGLRLDAPRGFLAPAQVHLRGHLPLDRAADEVVVPVTARDGRVAAWAALVPYLREGDVSVAELGTAEADLATRHAEGLAARYAAIQRALAERAGSLPRLVLTHAFAAGGTVGSSERPVLGERAVGRLSLCRIDALAAGSAYVALGHLHRPQRVGGNDHWRYCGSLLPMAMDEATTLRQVLLVDVDDAGGSARVQARVLPGQRAYARISGDIPTVLAAIAALPQAVADALPGWCDLTVAAPTVDPGLVRELHDRVAARGWMALAVRRACNPDTAPAMWSTPGEAGVDGPTLDHVTPEAVFAEVARAQGIEPDADLTADFASLLADVQQAEV